uniref:UPF0175 family protein n=1 Tax=Caldimicrobium thiodismutans TaxID=1653476 RepID=A0A832GME6_9BACT
MRIELEIPELEIPVDELRLLLAIKLFEEKKVSLGKAAEIAGYSEKTFAELLLKRGTPPIQYTDINIKEELSNV